MTGPQRTSSNFSSRSGFLPQHWFPWQFLLLEPWLPYWSVCLSSLGGLLFALCHHLTCLPGLKELAFQFIQLLCVKAEWLFPSPLHMEPDTGSASDVSPSHFPCCSAVVVLASFPSLALVQFAAVCFCAGRLWAPVLHLGHPVLGAAVWPVNSLLLDT